MTHEERGVESLKSSLLAIHLRPDCVLTGVLHVENIQATNLSAPLTPALQNAGQGDTDRRHRALEGHFTDSTASEPRLIIPTSSM